VTNLNADTVDGIHASNLAKLDAVNLFTASRNEFNGEIDLYNSQYFRGQDSGGTARDIAVVLNSDITQFGNTNLPTNIQSNGTLTYNGASLATGSIDTTAAQTITVVDGLITNIA
jgi:hypothetical protein